MANRQSAIGNRQSAATLVELLVTMGVVAILMLGGVAVYYRMNRGLALQSATSSIESVLRAARAGAIHERGPAVVVAEPQPDNPALVGSVYALGRQTVSNWHFEHPSQFLGGRILGALGQEAVVKEGTEGHAPGQIGTALSLAEVSGASTRLEASSPYLDGLREGVFIECYVCPQAAPNGSSVPIVTKDTSASSPYWLQLVATDRKAFVLQGGVRLEGGSTADVRSSADPVLADEWSHVALAYYRDGRAESGNYYSTLVLRVNGEEVARTVAEGTSLLLAPNAAPLHIGWDGTNYFKGRIDELKIAGLVAGETHVMPKNAEVTLDAGGSRDGRVHFDAEGRLDATQHTRPVFFRVLGDPVSDDERQVRVVRVNWLGAVEVFNGEPPAEE